MLMIGCDKHSDVDPMPENAYISLKFNVADNTKSLINPNPQTSNFQTAGSSITLYDVFTPGIDDAPQQNTGSLVQYLDEQNLRCNGTDWIFTKSKTDIAEVKIPWTKSGQHDFFAHNSYDAASGQSIPYAVGYSSFEDSQANTTGKHQYFRIPASGDLTLTTQANQFDFLYSSKNRDILIEGHKQVEMNFKHLFAAVYFEVKNISPDPMRLNSFSLGGIKDKGNAEIAYNGNVTLNLSATKPNTLFAENQDQVLNTGESYVIYSDCGAGQAFLIWPHTIADFANASFTISYNLGRKNSGTWNAATDKTIKLSGADSPYKVNNWAAGSVYKYYITVSDSNISLSVIKVIDWINDDVILEE
jgi:hypothetical protein